MILTDWTGTGLFELAEQVFFAPMRDWRIYRRIWKLSKKEVWVKSLFYQLLAKSTTLCQSMSIYLYTSLRSPEKGWRLRGWNMENTLAFPSFQDAEVEIALSYLHRDFYDILDWLMQSEVKWIYFFYHRLCPNGKVTVLYLNLVHCEYHIR